MSDRLVLAVAGLAGAQSFESSDLAVEHWDFSCFYASYSLAIPAFSFIAGLTKWISTQCFYSIYILVQFTVYCLTKIKNTGETRLEAITSEKSAGRSQGLEAMPIAPSVEPVLAHRLAIQ